MGAPRTCCSTLLAIFLPPVGVFLARGCDCQLLINVLLTCCGYLPGIIHALFIICLSDDDGAKGLPVTNPNAPLAAPVSTPAPTAVPDPAYPQGVQPVTVQGHPAAPPPGQYPAVPPASYGAPPVGYPQQPAGNYPYPQQPKQV